VGKETKHVVRLGAEDRERLQALIRKGSASVSVVKRARVLLKADASPQGPGWSDEQIAEFAEVGLSTVHRVRQRFVEEGLAAAVPRKKAEGRQYQKLNRKQEARLIALVCGPAPEGHDRWTLRLLADRLAALGVVDAISHECVRKTLKEANITIA
jgi:transposase